MEEALEYVERALAERSALARNVEGDLDVERGLAVAYEKVGNVLGDLGHFDQSIANFESSLEIRESLLEQHPESAQIQRDYAVAQYKLGLVHSVAAERPAIGPSDAAAQWEAAIEHFSIALASVRQSEALGTLQASDAHVPGMIEQHLEQCETKLLALE